MRDRRNAGEHQYLMADYDVGIGDLVTACPADLMVLDVLFLFGKDGNENRLLPCPPEAYLVARCWETGIAVSQVGVRELTP